MRHDFLDSLEENGTLLSDLCLVDEPEDNDWDDKDDEEMNDFDLIESNTPDLQLIASGQVFIVHLLALLHLFVIMIWKF